MNILSRDSGRYSFNTAPFQIGKMIGSYEWSLCDNFEIQFSLTATLDYSISFPHEVGISAKISESDRVIANRSYRNTFNGEYNSGSVTASGIIKFSPQEKGQVKHINCTITCTYYDNDGVGHPNNGNQGTKVVGIPIRVPAFTPDLVENRSLISGNGTLTIFWNSPDSSVSGLNLTLKDSTGIVRMTKNNIPSSSTSATYNVTEKDIRGATLTAYLKAIPAEGYEQAREKTAIVGIINNLPNDPNIEQTGEIITKTSSIKFDITNSDSNESNQDLYIEYQLDYQTNWTRKKGTRLNIQFNNNSLIYIEDGGVTKSELIRSGRRIISFRTYDGLEYSSTVQATFQVQRAPELGETGVTYVSVTGRQIQDKDIVSQVKYQFTTKDNSSPQISIQMVYSNIKIIDPSDIGNNNNKYETISSYSADLISQKKTIIIDIQSLQFLAPGDFFQIRFKIGNEDGDFSNYTNWTSLKKKARLPSIPRISNVINDKYYNFAKDNYFLNKMTISGNLSQALEGEAAIASSKIIVKGKNGIIAEKPCSLTEINNSFFIDGLDAKIEANEEVEIGFQVKDILNQTQINFYSQKFIKTSKLTQYSDTFTMNLNKKIIRPLSSESLDFQDFVISHTDLKTTGSTRIIFSYIISIPSLGVSYTFSNTEISSSTNELEEIVATIKYQTLNNIIQNLINHSKDPNKFNQKYENVKIIVQALDSFKDQLSEEQEIAITYIEVPEFKEKFFQIYHNFDIGDLSANTGLEVPLYSATASSKEDIALRLFNKGEGIIFKIPKAEDANNDVVQYQIFQSTEPFNSFNTVSNYDKVTFEQSPWLVLTKEDLEKEENQINNSCYYRIKVPKTSINEAHWYKIRAVDSMGNYSKNWIYSNTFIVNCRVGKPIFDLKNLTVQRQKDSKKGVAINFDFYITDLGGSISNQGWDSSYYRSFPNFEREIPNQNKKPKIKLELTVDTSYLFDQNPETFQITKTVNGIEKDGLKSFLDFSFINKNINFSNFENTAEKIYFKFSLIVSTGINSQNGQGDFLGYNYVESLPFIYTDLGEIPTVSYRKHSIGINSNAVKNQDVLVIESYLDKNQIRFIGKINGIELTQPEVIFDLDRRTIDNLIISGGTW